MGAGGICHECKRYTCVCYKKCEKIPPRINRKWGYYDDIFRAARCVFKRLTLKAGESTSFQKHEHRSEFWFVESGEGEVKLRFENEPEIREPIGSGTIVDVPQGTWHQIINNGHSPLLIYEMQAGERCEESDIVREE